MTKLEGVYPILNTTFHDDGSLDLDSQARLVEYLLEAGAHGRLIRRDGLLRVHMAGSVAAALPAT